MLQIVCLLGVCVVVFFICVVLVVWGVGQVCLWVQMGSGKGAGLSGLLTGLVALCVGVAGAVLAVTGFIDRFDVLLNVI